MSYLPVPGTNNEPDGMPDRAEAMAMSSGVRNTISDFAFQQARPSDLERVLAFVKAYYEFDGIAFSAGEVKKALEALLREPALGRVWIIRSRHEDVGCLIVTFGYDLEFRGRQATVTEFYIVPAYRRFGLGTKAVHWLEAFCREQGIGAIVLQVERHNAQARAFYQKLGFEAHHRIPLSKMLSGGPSRPKPKQARVDGATSR